MIGHMQPFKISIWGNKSMYEKRKRIKYINILIQIPHSYKKKNYMYFCIYAKRKRRGWKYILSYTTKR